MINFDKAMQTINKVSNQYNDPSEQGVFKVNSIHLLIELLGEYIDVDTKDRLIKTAEDIAFETFNQNKGA